MVLHHFSHRFDTAAQPSPFVLVLTAAALALALSFLKRVLNPAYDLREPPLLWPKVPFAGHTFSIVREGGAYYERLLWVLFFSPTYILTYLTPSRWGSTAQWFHEVPHMNDEIWGPDARAFKPSRFIDTPAEEEKAGAGRWSRSVAGSIFVLGGALRWRRSPAWSGPSLDVRGRGPHDTSSPGELHRVCHGASRVGARMRTDSEVQEEGRVGECASLRCDVCLRFPPFPCIGHAM